MLNTLFSEYPLVLSNVPTCPFLDHVSPLKISFKLPFHNYLGFKNRGTQKNHLAILPELLDLPRQTELVKYLNTKIGSPYWQLTLEAEIGWNEGLEILLATFLVYLDHPDEHFDLEKIQLYSTEIHQLLNPHLSPQLPVPQYFTERDTPFIYRQSEQNSLYLDDLLQTSRPLPFDVLILKPPLPLGPKDPHWREEWQQKWLANLPSGPELDQILPPPATISCAAELCALRFLGALYHACLHYDQDIFKCVNEQRVDSTKNHPFFLKLTEELFGFFKTLTTHPLGLDFVSLGEHTYPLLLLPYGLLHNHPDWLANFNHTRTESWQILFASWQQGWGYAKTEVEQDISRQIYSHYCNKYAVKMTVWSAGQPQEQILNYHELSPSLDQYDLVLDHTRHRILVRGKIMSARQMHSQSATIEIVDQLLSSSEYAVHNSRLPRSTYAANKNELLGKIILPLKKVIRHQTKKDFYYDLSGKPHDFHARLEMHDLSVVIVKNLFE